MSATTTARTKSSDLRVDLYRDAERRWRWRALTNGNILADSAEGYTRRIDCLRGAMRVVGVSEITWLGHSVAHDYGQSSLGRMVVEFHVWRLYISRPGRS